MTITHTHTLARFQLHIFTRFKSHRVRTNDAVSGFQTRRLANLQKLRGDDYRPNHRKNADTQRLLRFFAPKGSAFSFSEPNQREHVGTSVEEAVTEKKRERTPRHKGGNFSTRPHGRFTLSSERNPLPLGTPEWQGYETIVVMKTSLFTSQTSISKKLRSVINVTKASTPQPELWGLRSLFMGKVLGRRAERGRC